MTAALVDSFAPASSTAHQRFPRLDLAALVDPRRPPRRWTVRGVIPDGAAVALVAPPGVGKSLLCLSLAVAIARGERHFAALHIPRARRVLYVDMENTTDDLADRLEALGVTPDNAGALDRLVMLHLPDMAPLDTVQGGVDLEEILDAYSIGRGDLVILDSFQRVVQGPENDSDTYRAFYRITGVLLKRRGVTVIRTDNSGKDPERGARGSSSKRDDVDIEYRVTRDASTGHLHLTVEKSRIAGIEGVTFTRTTDDDGRLTYSTPPDPHRDAVEAARAALDGARVPLATGLNAAWKAVRDAGYGGPRTAVRDAMKERREAVPRLDGTPPAARPAETVPADDGTPTAHPAPEEGYPLESQGKTRAARQRHDDGTTAPAPHAVAVPPPPPSIRAAQRHGEPDPGYCHRCGLTLDRHGACPKGHPGTPP